MTSSTEAAALRTLLDRLGLVVPAADFPFLLRTFQRQRQLVDSWTDLVPATTEPAHAFAVSRSPTACPLEKAPTQHAC